MHSLTKQLCGLLSRLYRENKQLAVKVESTWGTEQCAKILISAVKQRHHKQIHTTYREFHTLISLWFLLEQQIADHGESIESVFDTGEFAETL